MNYCLNDNFGYKGLIALIAPKSKFDTNEEIKKVKNNEKI